MKTDIHTGLRGIILTIAGAMVAPAAAADPGAVAESGSAAGILISTELAEPLVLAGRKQRAFLKIGLTGVRRSKLERAPLNIAIVLDRSSSMSGSKFAEAKRAAMMTVDRLTDADFVSVIAYGSFVDIVVPATRVRDKARIKRAIAKLTPSGRTALFAGVSRGASELREFLDPSRVNRVILLSDGRANVGPSSPGELASLGGSLSKEGIAVTTFGLGLGYNEDLMYKLAMASDGNHAFIEDAQQLARYFEYEFGDAMSVVAQGVDVRFELDPGVRPIRLLGRGALIEGQKVTTRLNQLLAGHEKFVLLEVEVPATVAGASRSIGDVAVSYDHLGAKTRHTINRSVSVSATASANDVERRSNKPVLIAVAELLANERSKLALALRDEGKIDDARQLLQDNARYLEEKGRTLRSPKLRKMKEDNISTSKRLKPSEWRRTRKQMRDTQYDLESQSTY